MVTLHAPGIITHCVFNTLIAPFASRAPLTTNQCNSLHTAAPFSLKDRLELMLSGVSASMHEKTNRSPYIRPYSGQRSPTKRTRSRSPHRDHPLKRTYSPPGRRASHGREFFRAGADNQSVLSVCAVCLGRNRHIEGIHKCNASTTWDGQPTYASRNQHGRLINSRGLPMCSDWQRPKGCPSHDHDARHICSGCGDPSHGAQECPRAQKD
jgi:hypothetical protein